MKRALSAILLLGALSGCIPLATLRSPEPVKGNETTVGGTLLIAAGSGSDFPVAALPHLSFATGDGDTEFNISAQFGVRGGIKQKLAPGFALDGGVSLPFVALSGGGVGIPVAVDLGLIAGFDSFYITPHIQWIGFSVNNSLSSGFLYQLGLGYYQPGFILEAGATFSGQGGGVLLGFSGAMRF